MRQRAHSSDEEGAEDAEDESASALAACSRQRARWRRVAGCSEAPGEQSVSNEATSTVGSGGKASTLVDAAAAAARFECRGASCLGMAGVSACACREI